MQASRSAGLVFGAGVTSCCTCVFIAVKMPMHGTVHTCPHMRLVISEMPCYSGSCSLWCSALLSMLLSCCPRLLVLLLFSPFSCPPCLLVLSARAQPVLPITCCLNSAPLALRSQVICCSWLAPPWVRALFRANRCWDSANSSAVLGSASMAIRIY